MTKNPTDNNQASEDELDTVFYKYLGGTPDSDEYQDWLELKQAIQAIIRTEKLKLLAEVRERVVGSNETDFLGTEKQFASPRQSRNSLRAEQLAELDKLEAEL